MADATCDLPPEFLAANDIRVLPVGIRVGERRIVDDSDTTLTFYSQDLPKVGPEDGTEPLTPAQTYDWFLEQLVTDFDYVICLTVTSQLAASKKLWFSPRHCERTVMPVADVLAGGCLVEGRHGQA